jgi:hypothetical protein
MEHAHPQLLFDASDHILRPRPAPPPSAAARPVAAACSEAPAATRAADDRGKEEVPGTPRLTLVIVRSGAADVSQDDLRKVVRLSPETLQALVGAGQVMVLQANGQRTYRTMT